MVNSPIIWVGGKYRVMPHILATLPKADCLVEPFMGSGSVFLNTDYKRYILCDSNAALINFFSMVKFKTNDLLSASKDLFDGGNNSDSYYSAREAFNMINRDFDKERYNYTDLDLIRYAALFLYLNRHCFKGLYRVNSKNEFNAAFGDRKKPLFPVEEILHFAKRAWEKNAMFISGDFRITLPIVCMYHEDTLIYCDPPYLPASKTANFTTYAKPFTANDHRDLVRELIHAHRNHNCLSVISGSDTPETHQIYSSFTLKSFEVRRYIGTKTRDMVGEVIGSLHVCDCCGRVGGGCPDCGAVMGDATYSEMVASGDFDEETI